MKDGQQIRFSGEGDQQPGLEAGDVVIVLDEKEHNVFKREGIDLYMTMQITLTEALCGFQRHIQTPDNRTLAIMSLPGIIIIIIIVTIVNVTYGADSNRMQQMRHIDCHMHCSLCHQECFQPSTKHSCMQYVDGQHGAITCRQ